MQLSVGRKKRFCLSSTLLVAIAFGSWLDTADARVGGGGSSGSRGSRSFSVPARPSSPAPGGVFGGRENPSSSFARPSTPRAEEPFARPNPYASNSPFGGGGFLRGVAGGLVGGLVGSLLFRSLGFAGAGAYGGGGWGGPGLFDLLLLGLVAYLGYRWFARRSTLAQSGVGMDWSPRRSTQEWSAEQPFPTRQAPVVNFPPPQDRELDRGLDQLRTLDPSFDPQRFCDQAMDWFFRLQAAWSAQDLSPLRSLLTDEMTAKLQSDVERLKRDQLVNRVENIAVRTCEVTEAWQESGQDFVTVYFYANCLDYDVNEKTGEVVRGSKTEPSKFEEFWTFTRTAGSGAWKLSAINQA